MTEAVPGNVMAAVVRKLGLALPVCIDREGLQTIFKAWCRSTGCDTIALALRAAAGGEGRVPGFPPQDYFESWLAYGISNVCFANAEALRALLVHVGFPVARIAGSTGSDSPHGSLIVTLKGERYLVDPMFLAEEPLHLVPGERTSAGAGPLRIWADTDGTIRWQMSQARFTSVFRIERTDCDFETFRAGHETTKEGRAHGRLYKETLFVRRNVDGGTLTYDRGAIITKRDKDFNVRRSHPDRLPELLSRDFGIAAQAVARIPAQYLR